MRRLNSSSLRAITSSVEMEFSKLQARSAFLPPHKTQLPPRLNFKNPPSSRSNCVAISAAIVLTSVIFYFCFVAWGLLLSARFPKAYGVVIDAGSTGSRIHVFEYVDTSGSKRIPHVRFNANNAASIKTKPGLSNFASSPERAGDSLRELLDFAKENVPLKQRKVTKIYLMATAGLRRLDHSTQERILESCRRILRYSGFLFRDDWASIITGPDEGIFAWVAANYALGTLGDDPKNTVGIIELGGASAQVTFVPQVAPPPEFLQTMQLGGVTYKLYSHSFLHFGQEAAMEALFKDMISGNIKSSLASEDIGAVINPCTPRGYTVNSKEFLSLHANSVRVSSSMISQGNFSECKNMAIALLRKGQDDCLYQHCRIGSTYIPELEGRFFATENFFYTSQFFGLASKASLADLARAGQRYCDDEWADILERHSNIEKEDLLKYCFSSAYIVALLNESLGVSMNDERIRFTNQVGAVPLDWALGAFILRATEGLSPSTGFWFFDEDSLSFFSLLVILSLVGFAGWSLLKWRKPHLKTIYDLEKGRYIVTSSRGPR
eukprot:TRINITY_DN12448_c0_g1_i1.p1 TRINITY_DN12448_c0_g1~~TRINITY_DN12448_c0_g1_i1.p1  ORF type:complete len:551 (+),score=82.76 TRINITY_DN12448_c0_g1_i1:326-1978(+)